MAFQRDTDRLIHTASGEFLGLCVDIFNRFFNRVSVVACRGGAYVLRSGIDGLIATAAGVQRASARPTLAIVGDLSALYDLNSLALLRQASAPLVLIVVE